MSYSPLNLRMFIYMYIMLLGNELIFKTSTHVAEAADLTSVHPTSSPYAGGTTFHVNGTGFLNIPEPRCQLTLSSLLAITFDVNTIINNTYMTCVVPAVSSEQISSIKENGNNTMLLSVKGAAGHINITMFDLGTINVTSIQPNWGYRTESTIVNLYGNGFVNTTSITCNIGTTSFPGVYYNTSRIQCELPPQSMTYQVILDVYLNGQTVSRLSTLDYNITNLFTYFATPPHPVSSSYEPSYSSIILTFDREVEIGGEELNSTSISNSINCNLIFTSSSVESLGDRAKCDWLNTLQRGIEIKLGINNTINPGSVLGLIHNSLRTRYVAFSKHSQGNVTVQSNRVDLLPVAIIEHPQTIPTCGNITLHASSSLYPGPAPMLYEWNITSTDTIGSGSEDELESLYSIQDALPKGFTEQATITLSSSLFTDYTDYTFTLTVQNYLGHKDTKNITLTKDPTTDPNTPLITVIGGREKRIAPNKELLIETMLVNYCMILNSSLYYQWLLQTENMSFVPLTGFTSRHVTFKSPLILLPPHTLREQDHYLLTISVTSGTLTTNITSNVTLILSRESAKIDSSVIQGGNVVLYDVKDNIPLRLDINPSLGQTAHENEVIWSCRNEMNNGTCGGTGIFHQHSSFQNYIPGLLLSAGSYEITASFYSQSIQYNTSQKIIISNINNDSNVTLVYLMGSSTPVATHRTTAIRGRVRSVGSGSVTWNCIRTAGYAYINISDTLGPNKTSIRITSYLESISEENHALLSSSEHKGFSNPVALVIPGGALLPNNKYKFRLSSFKESGEDEGGRYAEVDVYTGSPPSSGQLLVEPLNGGSALITLYTIRAIHWTDEHDDMPLKYRYGYSLSHNISEITWMTPITGRDHISSILPTPAHDNSSLLVAMEVFDTKGSVNMAWKSISISQPDTVLDLTGLMENIQRLSLLEKRWIEGLASLTVLLSSVSNATGNMVAGGIQLPMDTVASLLKGMETIVTSYTASSGVFLDNGVSRQEAELILSIYNQLGESHRTNEINYDQYRIISNQIDSSYQAISDTIGYGLCQQLEAQDEAISLTSPYFGVLKVYYSIPPWGFNIACDDGEVNCPVFTSSVTFGEKVFKEYVQRYCTTLSSLGNLTSCEGVCMISRQAVLNSHWNGNPFSNHIKSQPVRIDVFSKEGVTDSLMTNVSVLLSLYYPISDSGAIECVYWNNVTEQWAQCINTTVVSSTVVECSCELSNEIAVIDKCPSGYYGRRCNELCPQGLWGYECSQFCRCNQRGTCSQVNGDCDCEPGWAGDSCQTKCEPPHWGKGCLEDCLCENGLCDFINGSCDCYDGWVGATCNESCSDGFFGKYCSQNCTCRSPEECSPITGYCTCQAGYTGSTCYNICPEGSYGFNCSISCNCSVNGTSSCDNVNGTCYCLDEWTGDDCDEPIFSPVSTTAPEGIQIWWILLPVLLILSIVVIAVVLAVILVLKNKSNKRKLKIQPIDPSAAPVEDTDIEGDENSLTITRSKSLVRVIRRKQLQSETGEVGQFKEPEKIGSKLRWQIIKLIPVEKPKKSETQKEDDDSTSENELQLCLEESDEFEEEIYLKGVYLEPTSTLKDLRNNFIDSNQLETSDVYFQFLNSDTPGDLVQIDNEEEIKLERFEEREKTLYIQAIDKNAIILELCVCGKFAELECTDCRGKGYCSETCQTDDWPDHVRTCRVMSARRKEERRQRKQSRREKRIEKLQRTGFTPNPDICRCGKLSEYECSSCGMQGYCSYECQIKDWKYHKLLCTQR
uniref:MYND-type domain-containing protein n=1 Tax=Amphimedon queenslandica TaxID=400682 RepID=A0A1X7V0T6_AMPQE